MHIRERSERIYEELPNYGVAKQLRTYRRKNRRFFLGSYAFRKAKCADRTESQKRFRRKAIPKYKRHVVTGSAGFIGSHVADRLLKEGNEVICIDNLLSGKKDNFVHNEKNRKFKFVQNSLDDINYLTDIFAGTDTVFHFAANADIRGGIDNTRKDLELNTIVTYNVLEAMRRAKVKKIVFASSSAVYGEPTVYPTPEEHPLIVTSLYGASKVACEAFISAYCSMFDFRAWVYRFVGVIGERHSHGVIYDFANKLKKNPKKLEILGDGNQIKSFLYVGDCINGIMFAYENAKEQVNIYNLGTDEEIKIKDLANIVIEEMGLKNVSYCYTGGIRGWKGDSPRVRLSIDKIKKLGWKPETSIEDSIRRTVRWLLERKK